MQRYFIATASRAGAEIEITGGDYHHIKNVMRMRVKDRIIVCPGDGKAYFAEISGFGEKTVAARIIEEIPVDPEMRVKVTVAHGFTRSRKHEEAARRLAELGAAAYLPVRMERSVAKGESAAKRARLEAIAKEACEQSGRNRLLNILPPLSFVDFLDFSRDFPVKIYAYEEVGAAGGLRKIASGLKDSPVLVLIGPEGGIAPNEARLLDEAGFTAVGLGPRILRTETAPLYVMSVLAYETEL